MPSSTPRLKTVVVAVVFIVAAICAFRFIGPRILGRSKELKATLVAQEEGHDGKLVEVRDGGRVVASYRCTANDAAVAVVSVQDGDDQDRLVWYDAGAATDPGGNEYALLSNRVGHFFFFTLLRGFGITPKSVVAKGHFEVVVPLARQQPDEVKPYEGKGFTFTFTKIAAPQRFLTAPTGKALAEAEKVAVANYDPGSNTVRLSFPSNQHPTANIVGASFCTGDVLRMLQPPKNVIYKQTGVVKVRFMDWRSHQTNPWFVSYRNAKVVTKNGRRQIVFPTSQDIGQIEDGQAHIESTPERSISFKPAKEQVGDVHISINDGARNGFDQPKLTLLSMTPSVEEMGLDAVNLLVEKYRFNQRVLAKPNFKGHLATTIPQLTFQFQLTHTESAGSRDLILPVHHPETK